MPCSIIHCSKNCLIQEKQSTNCKFKGGRFHKKKGIYIYAINYFFFARITLAQKDKGVCEQMCHSSELVENEKVCNGTAPSNCRTLLSCQDNCACWLNLQCNGGSGGQPSNGKVFFLGPRGPLGLPSMVRLSARPSARKIWISCIAL